MKKTFLKILFIGLFLSLLAFVRADAQVAGPQAFITWKAKGYAPTNYTGKILPGSNSPILANVEVFSGGKVINLSALTIYWYLNDRLLDRGVGLQAASFRTPQSINGGTIILRVEIPDYPGGGITSSVNIPLVTPTVVLWSPYPQDKLNSQSVQVSVLPYFFTVPDISFLTFSWAVNGKDVQTTENPQVLQVNVAQGAAPGSALDIKVSVANPAGYFESSSDEKSLTLSL